MSHGIGNDFREAFRMILEEMGQTIIVHEGLNTLEARSYEARGLKNTKKSSRQVVFQFPEPLNIQPGTVLQAKGSRDYWRVTDTEDIVHDDTFINFEAIVEKINLAGEPTRPSTSPNAVYNLHGTHARVNINSQDVSVNISHEATESVFADMRQIIKNQLPGDEDRAKILYRLDELENSKDTSKFTEKYREFIEAAANHMTLLAPFIPALAKMLGS